MMDRNMEWILNTITNPTREAVLELASLYVDALEALEAVAGEHDTLLDESLADTEDNLALLEKVRVALQTSRIEHKQAAGALEAIRSRLGIREGTVAEVAKEIESLFAPASKIDKQIAELLDGLLEMQAKKGRVDILTKLVSIQKIKLCARGEPLPAAPSRPRR